jgi:hypothetical protein
MLINQLNMPLPVRWCRPPVAKNGFILEFTLAENFGDFDLLGMLFRDTFGIPLSFGLFLTGRNFSPLAPYNPPRHSLLNCQS